MIRSIKNLLRRILARARNYLKGPEKATEENNQQPGLQTFDQGKYHTAVNRFGIYAVDMATKHRPATQMILKGQVHEPLTVEFIVNRCGSGDVVQAGVFFGDFLPPLAAGMPKSSLIWAFEPNPRSYFLAGRTIALNGLTNVRLRNAALSDKAGDFDLVVEDDVGKPLGGLSHLAGYGNIEGGVSGKSVKTEVVKLDDAVPEHRFVSIIQLDVEGHELQALSGARRMIEKNRPILILENVSDPANLAAILPDLGYRPVGTLHGRNTVFLPKARF